MPTVKHITFNFAHYSVANYGPYWRNTRRISVVELLSSQCLHASSNVRAGEVQDMARRLFRSWKTLGSIKGLNKMEVRKSLFELALNVLMTLIAGKRFYGENIEDLEDMKRLREGVERLLKLVEISNIEDFIPLFRMLDLRGVIKKSAKLAGQNKEMTEMLIEEHRRNTSAAMMETMIARLLEMQKNDPEDYKDETIQALIMTLIMAGTETTSNTLEWVMSHLANNPDVLKKAATEIDKIVGNERLVDDSDLPNLHYLHCILLEVLRLCPVVPLLIPHESREDVTIGGYDIPRGTMLLVNAYYIHRDPDAWDEPTAFKPERFENGKADDKLILPFGIGRRRCPGEGLAMRQMGLVLGTLIQCFHFERLGDELVDMAEAPGLSLAKAVPLEVMYRPKESMLKLLCALL